MRYILTAVALLSFLTTNLHAADRPNIIVLLADDVGFSDLGCYGSEIHTPNLDGLAATGVRFTNFYNTSRCCPSRACLLTGLYPHQAGVGDMNYMVPDLDGYVGDLNNHCVTIAQVLHSAGYATYMVGKWHVTKFTKPEGPKLNWPLQRGFDRLYGTVNGGGDYFDEGSLTRDNTMISPFVDKEYQPEDGQPWYYTNALGSQAARFIREHKQRSGDKPFFLYCAFTAAHFPMQALPRDIEKYKGVYDVGYEPIRQARYAREKALGLIDPKWELSPQWGDWPHVKNKEWEARCMQVFAADLDCMDQNVGKIVAALKDEKLFDNTLIMYMQDNGGNFEPFGRQAHSTRPDHPTFPTIPPEFIQTSGHPKQTRDGYPILDGTNVMPGPADTYICYGQGWANVSNTPFREYKRFVHEGGISSPLIAHWPNHIHRDG
jgi:arylsulfatase